VSVADSKSIFTVANPKEDYMEILNDIYLHCDFNYHVLNPQLFAFFVVLVDNVCQYETV
jgi:hypothetical protein